MVNAETIFNDLGINALVASEMLGMFDLTVDDLNIPETFTKLQSVINYINKFPEDTQRFLINKATRGKNVDKLDHMFRYTLILKDKEINEKLLDNTSKEISAISNGGDIKKVTELQTKKSVIETNIKLLNEEMEIFQK